MPKLQGSEVEIDEDVRAEMDKVANGGANGDVIKVGVIIDSDSKQRVCSFQLLSVAIY